MHHRASNPWTLAVLSGLLLVTACTDTSTLPSEVEAQYAKGGGGVTVTGALPNEAPQGSIDLDVVVSGSGFDESSTVEFLLAGKTTPKIVTNSSTFNDPNSVTANITIAVDADVASYDIRVTASRGRKGIGTELFGVAGNGGGGPPPEIQLVGMEVEVLDATPGVTHGMTDVEAVDAAIALATTADEFLCHLGATSEACTQTERGAFFGCPDDTQPCSRILFTFTGGSDEDNVGFRVSHSVQGCIENEMVVGGCVLDPNLAYSFRAGGWSQVSQPDLLIGEVRDTEALSDNGDGTRTLTIYWQGQRGQRRVWSDTERVWSRYPDLDPVGGTDYFVFNAHSGNRTFGACPSLLTPCWATYNGDPGTQAYVVLDDVQLRGRLRGKKPRTTGIEFQTQAFSNPLNGSIDYKDPSVVASNLGSFASVMLVDATGKQMLPIYSSGINPDDPDKPEIYKSGFRFTFPGSGCYEFRLLEVFIQDVDDLEYVWYSAGDANAVKTLRVDHVDGGETTWIAGGICPF